jgi:hypothetical protein
VQIDLRGRVANTKLPFTKPLAPLFEAVVNSFYAIDELGTNGGHIRVDVERDEKQPGLVEEVRGPVESFVITDDGAGFTDENFRLFNTADSTAKRAQGAKGVGRFLWLKAFASVTVESTFAAKAGFQYRSFDFLLSEKGVENHKLEAAAAPQRQTLVRLEHLDPRFKAHCPKSLEVIGLKLIEHCLQYFTQPNCPQVVLSDRHESFVLNDLFAERISASARPQPFAVKNQDLTVLHLRLYSSDETRHTLRYCANRREVLEENLALAVPDLSRKLRDEDGKTFVVSSYVSGAILDEAVNSERTGFVLPEPDPQLLPDEVTLADVRDGAVAQVRENLAPFLTAVAEEKQQQVHRYVETKAPQFRAVLKYHPETLGEIPAGLPEEKLDVELYRAQFRAQEDLRKRCERITAGSDSDLADPAVFRAEFDRTVEELNDFGKARLAEYIVHRKVALDLLERSLERTEEGRYNLEESVHRIIFPLRTTSDDIDFERQNLWVIDEKLCYHRYLASDKQLRTLDPVETPGLERPDLIIFDAPFAFVEEGPTFSAVVIVEFKRPVRDDFSGSNNPVAQVFEYVRKIRAGEALDRKGRPIPVSEGMPFYAYIVCDLTPSLRQQAEDYTLVKAPDGQGYFGFNHNLGVYVEVVSFHKLVRDAAARNRVLFDKLFGRR